MLVYNKHHLLPPFESNLMPGKELTVLRRPQQTWGVAICKDMDFTGLSRRYNRERAGLMLVPAWDFNMDRIWHGHMAILRGVEDGFSIARSAKQGYLTVSDSRGRILAEARSDAGDFATLLADVPVEHSATLYASLGDWCAWLALAAVLLGLVSLGQDGTTAGPGLKGEAAHPELANLHPV
jgi:apolipoprotein N-acyltransferase